MKNLIVTIALLCGTICAQPQITKEELSEFPETMLSDMDSLYYDWQSKNFINLDENCRMLPEGPIVSDSVYIDRLSRIPSIIEMPYNEVVKKYIEAYTGRLRNKVSFMLAAANFYMPMFEEALEAYDLPMELKYLPIIESALNPKAISRQRATGLWQFMLRTSQSYGLETNSLVEERFDPQKSTWAAVRYLKDLFDIAFGEGWDTMEDEAQVGEFYIDSLSVSLPYRNQGVGTALIAKAKEMAREKGIQCLTLAVEPANTAKNLYTRLGFDYQRNITIFNEEYHLYASKILV